MQAPPCVFHRGNLKDWASEGVKSLGVQAYLQTARVWNTYSPFIVKPCRLFQCTVPVHLAVVNVGMPGGGGGGEGEGMRCINNVSQMTSVLVKQAD